MLSKKSFFYVLPLLLLHTAYTNPVEKLDAVGEQKQENDLRKISESFGHLIGKNLESLGFELDMNQIIKGIQDEMAGKTAPLSETECVQAISLIQEEAFKKLSSKNLFIADEFMKKNSSEKGIVEIEKGKIQFKVEKEGNGQEVKAHDSPIIKYTGRFLDGSVFGSSQEEEAISLDETIAGFTKGIVGMKEGEKRTLFIHPEAGYGTSGYLPPNSLLTFDIELIKASSTESDELSEHLPQNSDNLEISSKKSPEVVR